MTHSLSHRALLQKFLSGIETGDAMAAAVVDEDNYRQHNPETLDGGHGIAALFARISKTNPKVTFYRVFEDGDYAFAHNEYDFADIKIAFEVFRFEDGRAVEHWDNLQALAGPNPAGRGMIEGATEILDLDKTEANRRAARAFVQDVLIGAAPDRMSDTVAADLIQHNPDLGDGIGPWHAAVVSGERRYDRLHLLLAEGNFTLCQCEGHKGGQHVGLYDLYRWDKGQIVEHWSTIEAIPPRSEWKNQNGKF